MVSLRFPFSSFPPPGNSPSHSPRFRSATIAAMASAAIATGVAVTHHSIKHKHKHQHQNQNQNPFVETTLNFILSHLPFNLNPSSSFPLWGSLSLSSEAPPVVDSKTGASFPSVIKDSQTLLGIGLRKKSILGLKNINVYAFGVYADEDDVQMILKEKYGKLLASDLNGNTDFNEDILSSDVNLTVRLQIVYSRLSIRSVRSAFEESVGSRLQKFGGPDNKKLLHRFTSQFKDDLKIPKGSVIELSREHGYVLRTRIDGEEMGSIQSKLLCQSVLDLYIGEDPFDPQAKQSVMLKLADAFRKDNANVN